MTMARTALFHRGALRRLALLTGAGLIVVAALAPADRILDFHGTFGFDGRLIVYAAFGWLGGLAVIGVAKALGAMLKRPANYYDRAG
jgi:hypothetical protein